jgi:hypothetical protein
MHSLSSIAHQPDQDRGRPRGQAARARGRRARCAAATEWSAAGRALSELGQSFGNVAATYHRVRPPWDHACAGSPFGPLHYERADDEQTVDVEELLTLYSTTSSLAVLSRDERAALFGRVRPPLAGPYRLPLRHELTWTRLAR